MFPAGVPPGVRWIVYPPFFFAGMLVTIFCAKGLLQLTKRVRVKIVGDHVEITETTCVRTRQTKFRRSDGPEIIFDRPAKGAQSSNTLTRPKRVQFGRGISDRELYEIYESIAATLGVRDKAPHFPESGI